MADMWRSREPPLPLDFDAIQNGTFVLRATPVTNGASHSKINGSTETAKPLISTAPVPSTAGLKDQRELTLADNLALFVASTNRLAARLQAGEETIAFDKDDDDTLDFVTATANLRSFAYTIERKTRWEVKGVYFLSPA